jgi:hypothetical protein
MLALTEFVKEYNIEVAKFIAALAAVYKHKRA